MEFRLDRTRKTVNYTEGKLYVNGQYLCDTLEDTVRPLGACGYGKIPGQTAIPAGRYLMTLTLSPKFKRKLPLLHDVPFFAGIRIHSGNRTADTEGCILVGTKSKAGELKYSRKMEDEVVWYMKQMARGEQCFITIS